MSRSKEELLIYGFVREHHKSRNVDLPPNDLILLFVSWIELIDTFDKNKIHKQITFDPKVCTKFKRSERRGHSRYASVVGSVIVTKGMKRRWKFNIEADFVVIGIMENEIIKLEENIGDFTNTEYIFRF